MGLETWLARNDLSADYLYVAKEIPASGEDVLPGGSSLPGMLADSGGYEIVYETEAVVILSIR